MVKRFLIIALALLCSVDAHAGLFGYTSKTNLPEHIESIHVAPVVNDINIAEEISDKERFKTYKPGIEVELTNAIINRFIFDGTLKVANPAASDAILEAKLKEFRRSVRRYTDGDDVEEYRLSVTVEFRVYDAKTGQAIISTQTVTGDSDYFLSGSQATLEDEASLKAVEDAARRVIEKTVEVW